MNTRKQIAINAVLKAGELCQQVQDEMVSTDAIQKSDRSPVTVADFGSQALICNAISDAFPEDIIVAEEDAQSLKQNPVLLERVTEYVRRFATEDTQKQKVNSAKNICEWIDRGSGEISNSFWTLDPIDGTKGFLRNDQYAIALAWIVEGEVQLGVLGCPNLPHQLDVLNPERGCLFVAVRGEGTTIYTTKGELLEKAHVSENASRLAESFESTHGDSNTHIKIAKELGLNKPPLQIDSQAKYGIVARGEASLYIRLPNPAYPDYRECIWDHAAGLIVVEEAGGKVTDANGKSLSFLSGRRMTENRGVVATNGSLHEQVLSVLSSM
ncbi:MAG: 3'(2'),5'-bisphosphate nucleotidase [Candidatus Poribacteria bacterium]|nr:3'(2'),5'-bisphosphate nucleotidase [Candidatus Poribacteria bacterium]